jgi:hypothetical protein
MQFMNKEVGGNGEYTLKLQMVNIRHGNLL